jgi:L-iditol 2-dehydrogenase
MRAAVLYGKEDIRIEDIPSPDLKAGEVRIAIQTALTCGTDLKVFKRGYHAKMIVPPAVFGHELSGTISEVHPQTLGWTPGDRVTVANSAPCGHCFFCRTHQQNLCDDLLFLNGAYAEEIVVPSRIVEKNLLRLKPATSFRDAALTEPLACVVQAISEIDLKGTERILVIGSGPIGLMFVATMRHMGCEVSVIGRGEKRLATAKSFGASVIQGSSSGEIIGPVKETGKTFDVVVEAIGKPEAWEAATQLVRKGGTINFFGGCPSGTFVKFDTGLIHYSNLKLLASFHHTPSTFRKALSFIEDGVISSKQFVDGDSSLSNLPDLFFSMIQGNKAVKTAIDVHA